MVKANDNNNGLILHNTPAVMEMDLTFQPYAPYLCYSFK